MARFVLAVLGRYTDQFVFTPVQINGEAGLAAIEADGRVFSVISIRTDGIRILDVFTVLNPDKLRSWTAAGPHHGRLREAGR